MAKNWWLNFSVFWQVFEAQSPNSGLEIDSPGCGIMGGQNLTIQFDCHQFGGNSYFRVQTKNNDCTIWCIKAISSYFPLCWGEKSPPISAPPRLNTAGEFWADAQVGSYVSWYVRHSTHLLNGLNSLEANFEVQNHLHSTLMKPS